MLVVANVNFTESGRAKFVKFLDGAYGEARYVLQACENECLNSFAESLNSGESLRWEISRNETRDRQTHEFRADEADLIIDRENVE